jgi:hypothetical protein
MEYPECLSTRWNPPGSERTCSSQVLRLLVERGAVIDTVTSDGWTAFHFACFAGQAGCAEALARAGCDVGIKDVDGDTGWQLAEGRGHTAAVERLWAVTYEQLRSEQAADSLLEAELMAADGSVEAGLGRIVAVCGRSSASYQHRDRARRCLFLKRSEKRSVFETI